MTSLAVDGARIQGLSAGDVRAALKHSNPRVPSADLSTMAEIIALVSDVIAELPKAERSELARDGASVRRILMEAAGHAREPEAPDGRIQIKAHGRAEVSQGAGLGERLSPEAGREALARYATPRPLESWAGPVAGAGDIEKIFRMPRSTLANWHKRGAIIGLLRGERKLAYPLEQFLDGRPLEGIAQVLKVAPDARSAWLWLRQAHGGLDGAVPLDRLKAGEQARVVAVADRDFL